MRESVGLKRTNTPANIHEFIKKGVNKLGTTQEKFKPINRIGTTQAAHVI